MYKLLFVGTRHGNKLPSYVEEQMDALQSFGIQVFRYGITGKGILGYLRCLPALRRAIQQHQPDLIHAHYGLSGLLANLQRIVPVVTTYHGSDINKPNILRFSKIAMRLSVHNIFVSQRNVAIALGDAQSQCSGANAPVYGVECKGKGSHTLLPCGVNIPKPWNEMQNQGVGKLTLNQWVQSVLSKDVKNVLFAGAFDNAVKDPELAFAAIQVYNTAVDNGQWAIESNGQSPMTNCPIKLLELKGYNRDQVNALMYNCDALLMTSKTEGSPQVIKEAMACGCPIVSVDVGDVAERTSGVEGCYVVSSREPTAIAEALQQALAFLGKTNGRQRIIEMGLSNTQVAERLMAIYQSLV